MELWRERLEPLDASAHLNISADEHLPAGAEHRWLNSIDDYELDAVCQFTYLGSTITDNLSLDVEIDKMIGKSASNLARLTARLQISPKLSVKTNMVVYNACVTSTLMYGSDTWTTYAGQEKRLRNFHTRSIIA